MPSFADDPRRGRLVSALVPLLADSCPKGGGGYGGAFEVRLPFSEVEELGGLGLFRSALRAAGRSLDWKVETYGVAGAESIAGAVDRREVPAEFAEAIDQHMGAKKRDAIERSRPFAATGGAKVTSEPPGVIAAQRLRDALAADRATLA
ncbi:hypothetical protein ACFVZ3_06425 [Kitasatospora purpeofusca]|uniref:hypothetical protein n=1 Tax=Kitasatospora purpeofusca TaxID=67352 RepID=UPI00368B9C84